MPDVSGASAANTGVHTHYQHAHTRLRVHWAPGIPAPLIERVERSGKSRVHSAAGLKCTFAMARDDAAFSTVIVRLDRTIQHSRDIND
jgi:hypothetical protein